MGLLTDGWDEARDVEKERDQLRALTETARAGMRQLGEDLEACRIELAGSRAEVAEAHVADLRGALAGISRASEYLGDCASPELIELGLRLKTCCTNALMRTPAESLARCKAEALRDEIPAFVSLFGPAAGDALEAEADRLEKEAANGR